MVLEVTIKKIPKWTYGPFMGCKQVKMEEQPHEVEQMRQRGVVASDTNGDGTAKAKAGALTSSEFEEDHAIDYDDTNECQTSAIQALHRLTRKQHETIMNLRKRELLYKEKLVKVFRKRGKETIRRASRQEFPNVSCQTKGCGFNCECIFGGPNSEGGLGVRPDDDLKKSFEELIAEAEADADDEIETETETEGAELDRPHHMESTERFHNNSILNDDFRKSISSIEEEAARVEAVMIMAELHRCREELSFLAEAKEDQDALHQRLQQQLHEKSERISTLELEQELLTTESNQAKEDLASCIQYLANVRNATESPAMQNLPTSIEVSSGDNLATPSKQKAKKPKSFLHKIQKAVVSSCRSEKGEVQRCHHPETPLSTPLTPNTETPRTCDYQSDGCEDWRQDGALGLDCYPHKRNIDSVDDRYLQTEDRPSPIFSARTRSAKKTRENKNGYNQDRGDEAVDEADDLRDRLEASTQFYDKKVRELQLEIAQMKQQLYKMKSDRAHQLAKMKREQDWEASNLRSQIHQKDMMIAQLRRENSSLSQNTLDHNGDVVDL